VIPFADGHTRNLSRLTAGPFRYHTYAVKYLEEAKKHTQKPVKQAVISASVLSLLYPSEGIDSYSRESFLEDLISEAEADIRRCLDSGAHRVQIDFTEGRLSVKLDPSKKLLKDFVKLNNLVLDRFAEEERKRLGVHTCPGVDLGGRRIIKKDYAELLPSLFELKVGNFYIQMASESNRPRVLDIIKTHTRGNQRIFIGVIDPINPSVETPQEVRDRVLEAAEYISPDLLGSTDDCGFSPFGDDTSTSRETAFEKIRSRVVGTELAAKALGK
jgi:5-methyltetrahydropteroyltriglutamate--homocysteine methyltransferase